eukprot:5178863-Pleurochrysis_carterae.AAC.1
MVGHQVLLLARGVMPASVVHREALLAANELLLVLQQQVGAIVYVSNAALFSDAGVVSGGARGAWRWHA